jgi:Anti-sigma-K factor rskA
VAHTDPELLALTALGEDTGNDRDAAHLAQCADCRAELERLTRVVGLARDEGPAFLEQPPATLWEQIAAAVGPPDATAADERPGAEAAPGAVPAGAGRRRRRLVVAVAGLAAGLVIGIGGTVAVTQLTGTPASQVVAQVALRPLPQFPQYQGATGTAVLRDDQAALQLTVSVAAPARSGFYEVWLLGSDGTSMISLGDLGASHAGTFNLPAGADLRFYSRVDVSLQPFNGSTQHSGTSVVRGPLPATAAALAGPG